MRRSLVIAAILWPAVLAAALVDRLDDRVSAASTFVYLAASRICHQAPDRSFATAGHRWPVCGRCAGLYLAGPFGAIVAARLRRRSPDRLGRWLLAAAAPTAITLVVEWWSPTSMSSQWRMAAALPLGAAIAGVIVSGMPAHTDDPVN